MAKVEEKISELLEDKINNLGYELYDVEYVKEGKEYYLRIYIDKESGIDLEDCEKVSNEINEELDKEELIKEQYFLEVSSPGVERVLRKDKHLVDNIGKKVQIKLFKTIENKKQYIGILNSFDELTLSINVDDIKMDFDRKNISQIKTIFEW